MVSNGSVLRGSRCGGEVEEWLLTVVLMGQTLRKLELLHGSESTELCILRVQRSCYLVTR